MNGPNPCADPKFQTGVNHGFGDEVIPANSMPQGLGRKSLVGFLLSVQQKKQSYSSRKETGPHIWPFEGLGPESKCQRFGGHGRKLVQRARLGTGLCTRL